MSRDYKKKGKAADGGRGRPMGTGIIIGLLLGLSIAIGVALYINKGPSPFVEKFQPASPAPAAVVKKGGNTTAKAPDPKLEFDFYKILPGWEEAVTDRDFNRKASPATKEIYYLQVAAFPNPSDADNLKARLALSGIESKIQTATLPDGKIWHRVRVGPFSEKNELSDSRAALNSINLDANLIKVRESNR